MVKVICHRHFPSRFIGSPFWYHPYTSLRILHCIDNPDQFSSRSFPSLSTLAKMETNPQDRLAELFAGKPLPTRNKSAEPHFSEQELQEKREDGQSKPKWQLPLAAEFPRQIPKAKTSKPQPTRELLTSSDDEDDYVSSFSKKPSMKTPAEHSATSGRPAAGKSHPVGGIEYIHEGKRSSTHSHYGQSGARNMSDHSSDSAAFPIAGQFCQFGLAAKFPYKYMNDTNDRVSRHFFANNKFFSRDWDL